MNDTHFLECLMRYQDSALSPDQIIALEQAMLADPAKRQLFAVTQLRSLALHDRFRQQAFQCEPEPTVWAASVPDNSIRSNWCTRPLTTLAAGLVIGLFSASLVWAISSPKTTTERLFSLLNGSFDEPRLQTGFPHQTGVWSGDQSSIADGRLRFVAPGSDSGDPSARAISCDVYQLVDLRPLRHTLNPDGDAVLELSSDFIDARPTNTKPSVTFFCQLYLFQGDPSALHQGWPQNITDTLASGCAQATTLGSDAKGIRTLTAKCLIPGEADFALIQIAARPNLRPARLDSLFADNVNLTLKTQPTLPIRIVQVRP